MTAETPVFSQILLDVQNCLFRLLWFLHLLHDSVYTRFTITATSVGTGRQNKSLCQPKDIKIRGVETDSLISEYFAGLAYVICHFLCYANTPARQLLHLPRVNTVTRASVCYHSCSILARSTWVLSISNIIFFFICIFSMRSRNSASRRWIHYNISLFFFQERVIRDRQRLAWAHKKIQNMQSMLQELPRIHPLPCAKLIWKLCMINS